MGSRDGGASRSLTPRVTRTCRIDSQTASLPFKSRRQSHSHAFRVAPLTRRRSRGFCPPQRGWICEADTWLDSRPVSPPPIPRADISILEV